jgi:hypothetical protein
VRTHAQPEEPAVVVATPGAESVAASGYGATLLRQPGKPYHASSRDVPIVE